jgi:excisionase family DNA binding protein
MSAERLLTTDEVAARLRIGIVTVRLWAADGRLPCVRLSKTRLLFRPEDIEAVLTAATQPAVQRPA